MVLKSPPSMVHDKITLCQLLLERILSSCHQMDDHSHLPTTRTALPLTKTQLRLKNVHSDEISVQTLPFHANNTPLVLSAGKTTNRSKPLPCIEKTIRPETDSLCFFALQHVHHIWPGRVNHIPRKKNVHFSSNFQVGPIFPPPATNQIFSLLCLFKTI